MRVTVPCLSVTRVSWFLFFAIDFLGFQLTDFNKCFVRKKEHFSRLVCSLDDQLRILALYIYGLNITWIVTLAVPLLPIKLISINRERCYTAPNLAFGPRVYQVNGRTYL